MSTSEISEKDIRELQIRRKIAEIKKQRDTAWDIFYAKYSQTPEHKEYRRLKDVESSLYQELEEVLKD